MRFVIIISLFVFLLCGCSSTNTVTTPEIENDGYFISDEITRAYPDFSIHRPETRFSQDAPSPEPVTGSGIDLGPGQIAPVKISIKTPYTFTKANSAYTATGKIYFSKGPEIPELIWDNGHSPSVSGDWVFFIQPPGATPAGPARWNINSGEVEYLDTSMIDPPCNYLFPADEGNVYIYGAIGFDPGLKGWTHLVKDGQTVWSRFGSYFFPTLSADGSTAAWCYTDDPFDIGNRDPYIMDTDTLVITKIHTCTSDEEAQYICLSADGVTAGFTVVVNGDYDTYGQEAWRWQNGNSFKIDIGDYRWCEGMSISANGKYQAWTANKDPINYAGYSIMSYVDGEILPRVNTVWNPNIQDLWAGVDNNGRIIFAHGVSYWSHYIPSYVHVNSNNIRTITDPGGISRDFRYAN